MALEFLSSYTEAKVGSYAAFTSEDRHRDALKTVFRSAPAVWAQILNDMEHEIGIEASVSGRTDLLLVSQDRQRRMAGAFVSVSAIRAV